MPNARSRAGSGGWNCVPELPTGPEGAAGRAERTLRLALLFAAWAAWVWPPCCAEGHAVCRPSLPWRVAESSGLGEFPAAPRCPHPGRPWS